MNPNLESALEVLVMASMVIGLFGLVLPIFPGLVVIWASALGYGVASGFTGLGWFIFAVLTILMILGSVIDNIFIGAKALQKGASWISLGLASIAAVVGVLVFPPFGGLIGAFLAVFLFEYSRHQDWRKALQLTKGMAIGCGWAFVVRFGIGLVMISLWVVWAYTGW